MEILDRIYYMRAVAGVIAGIITAFLISPGTDQASAIGIAVLVAIVIFIFSVAVSKKMAGNVPKEQQRKVATNGIFPFIFLLIMFMILIYTALNQSMMG